MACAALCPLGSEHAPEHAWDRERMASEVRENDLNHNTRRASHTVEYLIIKARMTHPDGRRAAGGARSVERLGLFFFFFVCSRERLPIRVCRGPPM